jgi:hypothetical protein
MPANTPAAVIDQWTALCHKAGLDPDTGNIPGWEPQPWVPRDARRRLTAYRILAAYVSNVAREVMAHTDPQVRREHREFGDPAVMVSRIVSGLIGSEPRLAVTGGGQPPPGRPSLPPAPEPLPGDASDIEKRIQARLTEVHSAQVEQELSEWEQAWDRWPHLSRAHRWLAQWQEDAQYAAKVYEAEIRNAVPLGDGVLVLDQTPEGRFTLTVHEPDAYHPVLEEVDAGGYPTRVHLSWEEEVETKASGTQTWLRRITYELVALADIGEEDRPAPPWSDRPITHTCLLSNQRWLIESDQQWKNLDPSKAYVEELPDGTPLFEHDLEIDWIPVLHWPNTPETSGHFGRSSVSNVVQLFDALAALDTDLERASAIAGTPILGMEGEDAPADQVIRAGAILRGRLTPLDMSSAVTALLAAIGSTRDRLAVNGEVPKVALGDVDSTSASGISIALQFAPFEALIGMLRLSRRSKHPLIGKWALRWAAMSAEAGDPLDGIDLRGVQVEAVYPDSAIRDVGAVVTWVVQLLEAHGVSRATALHILSEQGIDIGPDIDAELARIREDDTDGARNIADATRDDNAARRYLGLPEVEEPDQITNPPTL